MKKDVFIGVDGGGTKTSARIEDQAGKLLGQGFAGPANIHISVTTAWDSVSQAISLALAEANLSLTDPNCRFHVGLGLAGCEFKKNKQLFLNQAPPFFSLQLVSDAHIACLGAHAGRDGAIIIIGTGIVGYQIQDKSNCKVSGWGFPHEDMGSGAWMGLEAVRLALQCVDHRLEKSPLIEEVFLFFNSNIDDLVEWAHHANATEYAKFAPLVIQHSQREDIHAVRLMKESAHAVQEISEALVKMQKETTLPCCLSGGIAPFIEPWLNESLREKLIVREGDAGQGAIFLTRNLYEKAI